MSETMPPRSESLLTPRPPTIQYQPMARGKSVKSMAYKPKFRVYHTLNIDSAGRVAVATGTTTYRAGLRALFNLAPRPAIIHGLAGGEATRLGFVRVGFGLRETLAKARGRQSAK